jgi:hypothetical protein
MSISQAAALGQLFFKPMDAIFSAARALTSWQQQRQHGNRPGSWDVGAGAAYADNCETQGSDHYGGDDGDGGEDAGFGDWGGSEGLGMDGAGTAGMTAGGSWDAGARLHDMEGVEEEGYELLQVPKRFETLGVNYSRSAKQVCRGALGLGVGLCSRLATKMLGCKISYKLSGKRC